MFLDAKAALVVEDEPVLRHLLVDHISDLAPGIELLAAGDGPSAWDLFRRRQPMHIVLDLSIPGYSGLTLLRLFTVNRYAPRVLIFSAVPPDELTPPAGLTEAVVVQKFAPHAALERGLLLLFSGRSLPRFRHRESGLPAVSDRSPLLTRTELLVLALLMEGLGLRMVAAELGISPHTVHTHRRNIMRKLGVKSAVMLARRAIELDLYPDVTVAARRRLLA